MAAARSGRGQSNRQCATCLPPCQGGEKLHWRGPCCHSYCDCRGFVEYKPPTLTDALQTAVVTRPLRVPQ